MKKCTGILRSVCNPRHVHSLSIFRALAYLEPEAYSKPCKTLIRHTQNPSIVRAVYSDIIQTYSEPCLTLTYAET